MCVRILRKDGRKSPAPFRCRFLACLSLTLVVALPVSDSTVVPITGWGYVVPSGYKDFDYGLPMVHELWEDRNPAPNKPAAPAEVYLYFPVEFGSWKDRLFVQVECRIQKKSPAGFVVCWSGFVPSATDLPPANLSTVSMWILANSTRKDSGWVTRRIDVTDEVRGFSKGTFMLGMTDNFPENLEQKVSFRKFSIVDANEPVPRGGPPLGYVASLLALIGVVTVVVWIRTRCRRLAAQIPPRPHG